MRQLAVFKIRPNILNITVWFFLYNIKNAIDKIKINK